MAEQAYAYVTLVPVAKGFQSAIAKEMSGLGGPGGTAGQSAGKSFSGGFGKALKGLAVVAGTALAAAGVGRFFSDSVKQASNLNESLNAVNVSFGDNAAGIKKLGQEAATSLGLSTQQFNQMAVGFTAFTEKIAGPGGDVVKVMDELTTRGADFASVMNLDVNEAMNLFRSGLAGETEPLRRYGVDISEAAVKAYAYANGIAQTGAELTEQQKIQARYGSIMEQTNKMAGDFANTSDGLANAQRILKAELANVQAEIGTALLPALQALIPALTPIVQQLGPILTRVMEALAPVIQTVTDNLTPLFDALSPLIDVFTMLVETVGSILSAILPPFIQMLGIITPVVKQLVGAFLPLIQKIMPVFSRLLSALMPFIEMFADYLSYVLIPALEFLSDLIADYLVWYIGQLATAFEELGKIIQPLWDKAKPFFEGLGKFQGKAPNMVKVIDGIAGGFLRLREQLGPLGVLLRPVLAVLGMLRKGAEEAANSVSIAASNSGVLDAYAYQQRTNGNAGGGGGGGGGGNLQNQASEAAAAAATAASMRKRIKDLIQDTKKDLIQNRKQYNEAVAEANKSYADAQEAIAKRYDDAVTQATSRRDQAMADALKSYSKSVQDINKNTAKQLADIVTQSMNRLRDAFKSVAQTNIASMFSSDAINKNVGGLIDGLRTKLTQSRQLIANAAKLSAEGFSQTFIEQVVAAGGETGNELAEGILNSTPEQRQEMKDLFNVIESEAETGMDSLAKTLYEKNGLATTELKSMYAGVLEEQRVALAEQKTLYDEQIAQIMVSFNQELADAKTLRDEALVDAEAALNEALLDANEAFLEGLDKIDKDFKEKLNGMKSGIKGLKTEITALQTLIGNTKSSASSVIAGLKPMATGGLVTGPTPALIGEAGPELVIPLDRFESLVAAGSSGKTLNYYAAPNQSVDSEQALFQAMRRAKVVTSW